MGTVGYIKICRSDASVCIFHKMTNGTAVLKTSRSGLYSDLEDLGLADVKYLYGHATLVAADLLEHRVEAGVELSPVFKLGVRTSVVGLTSHLLALQ